MEQDFLDEIIGESTEKNPHFTLLMEEARQRRELLQKLAVDKHDTDSAEMRVE